MNRAILFDKDGTLFGFEASWSQWAHDMITTEAAGDAALAQALADAVGYDLDQARFHPSSVVIAGTTAEVVDQILPVLPATRHTGLLQRLEALTEHVQMDPVCDLRAVLTELAEAGWRLGVVTNDSYAPSLRHLEDAGIADLFGIIIGFDSGHGGKPAPGGCLAAAQALGAAPQDCLMVGDSLTDMGAGRAAGMTCVAVTTGIAGAQDLAPYADHVLSSIADLPRLLA